MSTKKAVASTSFASTSYALDSSDEHFCSSSNEEELTLDWLSNSLKNFAIFIAKNKEFFRITSQQVQSLDNKSTIEKVTEVSKRVHKHLSKCISGLTSHKEEFKREYSEWCNKYIDKHSDGESDENPDDGSSSKNEKVNDVNRVKESKEDRKKLKEDEEGETSRTDAEPSKKKSSKKKSRVDEVDKVLSTEAEPSGKKGSKKNGREEEDGKESKPEAESSGNKESKSKGQEDERVEQSRTEAESSGKKSSKSKGRESGEVKDSKTEADSSGKKSSIKKKHDVKANNTDNRDEIEENEILQSSALSSAESVHDNEPEDNGQVVLESDDGNQDFDTNTLLMETPHSYNADESSFLPKSPRDKANRSNVEDHSNSTSDIFATSIEIDEAPRLQEETSTDANLAKNKRSDQDPDSKGKKKKSSEKSAVDHKKMSGKRPGPASKTCGSVASPARSEEPEGTNFGGKKQKANSVAESQATTFTEEDDEIQLREKQALDELLKSSEDSDDAELFKKPIKVKKSKKSAAKKRIPELFVPSNSEEFAHIAQLYQTCEVELTRCDKKSKSKKRGSKSRRDTDADIDK